MSLGAARFPADIGGVELPSPVLVAAGCAGTGTDLLRWGDVALLGAVTTPTLRARPVPAGLARVEALPGGVAWVPGAGVVAEAYLGEVLPALYEAGARVVAAVAGPSVGDLVEVVRRLRTTPGHDAVVAVELSLADEDAHEPGRRLGDAPSDAARVVRRLRDELPDGMGLLVRLEDERQAPLPLVAQVVRAGASGLVVSGAVPALLPGSGGLRQGVVTGAALLRHTGARLAHLFTAMRDGEIPSVPLVGVGGVRTAADAAYLVGCGATAVGLGSVTLTDPTAPWTVAATLPSLVRAGGRRTARDAAGRDLPRRPDPDTEELP